MNNENGSGLSKNLNSPVMDELMRRCVDAHGDAVFWIGRDNKIFYVNEAACRSLGYSREELVGKPAHAVNPQMTDEAMNQVWEKIREGQHLVGESVHRRKDGSTFPVEGVASRVEIDGQEYAYAFIRDITARKKTEEALCASEDRFRQIVHGMPVMMDAFDENGILLAWNKECERVTGYPAAEVVGNPNALNLFYPDEQYRQEVLESFKRAAREGIRDLEFNLTCKDGTTKTIAWSNISHAVPVPGWFTWAIGVDVTQRAQAEHALRESEALFHNIFHTSSLGTGFLINRHWKKVNQRLCQITGYSAQELIDQDTRMLYASDEEYRRVEKELHEPAKKDGGAILESQMKRKDGVIIDVLLSLNFLDPKNPSVGAAATILDITEQRKMHLAVQESEAKYRQVVELSQDLIAMIDLEGVIGYASPAAEKILGYPPAEMIGRDAYDFVCPEEKEKVAGLIKNLLEGQGDHPIWRIKEIKKDGSIISMEYSAALIKKEGRVVGFLTVGRDVTERHQVEKNLADNLTKFRTLYDLAVNMSSAKTLEENLQFIVEKSRELFKADTAFIALNNEQEDALFMHTVSGIRTEVFKNMQIPTGQGLGGLVMKTRQEFAVEDYFSDDIISHPVNAPVKEEGLVSTMAAPIQAGDKAMGVFYVANRIKTKFSAEDLETLVLFGNLAAVEIANKKTHAALMDATQRFKDIINFFPDATLVLDDKQKVITWNKAMEDLTSVKAEDVLGKGDYAHSLPFYGTRKPILVDLVFKSDEEIEKQYTSIRREGNALVGENYTPAAYNGKGAFCWGKASRLFDASGKLVGAIESVRDITDRKEMENQITRLNECFCQMGPDCLKNMGLVVETTGKLLGGTMALYSCCQDGKFFLISGWQVPQEMMPTTAEQEWTICCDFIQAAKEKRVTEEILTIPDLEKTEYWAKNDKFAQHHLKAYAGHIVKAQERILGVLCVYYSQEKILSSQETYVFSILARALGIEEERRETLSELNKHLEETDKLLQVTVGRETRMIELKKEVNQLSQRLGLPAPYEVSFSDDSKDK